MIEIEWYLFWKGRGMHVTVYEPLNTFIYYRRWKKEQTESVEPCWWELCSITGFLSFEPAVFSGHRHQMSGALCIPKGWSSKILCGWPLCIDIFSGFMFPLKWHNLRKIPIQFLLCSALLARNWQWQPWLKTRCHIGGIKTTWKCFCRCKLQRLLRFVHLMHWQESLSERFLGLPLKECVPVHVGIGMFMQLYGAQDLATKVLLEHHVAFLFVSTYSK